MEPLSLSVKAFVIVCFITVSAVKVERNKRNLRVGSGRERPGVRGGGVQKPSWTHLAGGAQVWVEDLG